MKSRTQLVTTVTLLGSTVLMLTIGLYAREVFTNTYPTTFPEAGYMLLLGAVLIGIAAGLRRVAPRKSVAARNESA
jgi:hypothetical protein